MLEYTIVFVILAVCAFFTIRMLVRVFTGRDTSCGLCQHGDTCSPKEREECDGKNKQHHHHAEG